MSNGLSIANFTYILDIAAYVLVIVVGFILSRKRGNIGAGRTLAAIFIPVVGFILEFFVIGNVFAPKDAGQFMIMSAATYLMRIVCFVISLLLFSGYFPSKPILVVLVILVFVYAARSLYTGKVMFGVNGFLNTKNDFYKVLIAFMNQPAAFTLSGYLCAYAMPIMLIIDAIGSSKNNR